VIFDTVSASQMQAARMLTGATMIGFLAARLFRGRAQKIQLAVAGLYITGVLGFVVYLLF
jgi:hypothetical protein